MTIGKINVEQAIAKANDLLQKEKNISKVDILLGLIILFLRCKHPGF